MKSKKLSRLLKIQAVVFTVVVAVGACSVGAFAVIGSAAVITLIVVKKCK